MKLELKEVSKRYAGAPPVITGVNLSIPAGKTIGLLGESGSGKTTIGQIAAGIIKASTGEVLLNGQMLGYPYKGDRRRLIQMVFQHPDVSFNPKMQLIDSMREPYRFAKRTYSESALHGHLEVYGIYPEHLLRYPSQLSGGELQRLALARIMLLEPKIIVLDEPTSMLDVISQAQVITLLGEMQKKNGLGYLFISHDRLLCEKFCDTIKEIKAGRIV